MSAPREVFQVVDDRDPVGTYAYSELNIPDLAHVTVTRYLRADLVERLIEAVVDAERLLSKLGWKTDNLTDALAALRKGE